MEKELIALIIASMMDEGMSPIDICLEFFWMGHESGHDCAKQSVQKTEHVASVGGYL